MSIAAGSASEVEYQLLLACDLNYIQDETYGEPDQQVNEVKRILLNSVIKKLTANVEKIAVLGQPPIEIIDPHCFAMTTLNP